MLLLLIAGSVHHTRCNQGAPVVRTGTLLLARHTFLARYLFEYATNTARYNRKPTFATPADMNPETIGNLLATRLKKVGIANQFLLGASTSEHQTSHQCKPSNCSWARHALRNNLPGQEISPLDMWHYYKDYADYAIKNLGINTLRVSVEWALVQPSGPDSFDQSALDHYATLYRSLIAHQITPIIIFHHYTDPCWFIDKGGFQTTKNIHYFVKFCTRAYEHITDALINDAQSMQELIHQHPPLWATFNSPEAYAFKGYLSNDNPPADPKRSGIKWACTVLKNMLEAHTQTYQSIKNLYADRAYHTHALPSPSIGFLKNIHQLDAAQSTIIEYLCKPISHLVCALGTMMQNESVYQFFTTGIFKIQIPGICTLHHENKDAPHALDWIGLNYYSNRHMFLNKRVYTTHETINKTDNPNYTTYPHGIYRAIVEISQRIAHPLHIPVYVTENGIATSSDKQRYEFYREYLYALTKAAYDGYPVHGYLVWTLADNYEWPTQTVKHHRPYGLCAVDQNDPSRIRLKPGANAYKEFIHGFKASLSC